MELSLIIPTFNEADIIGSCLARIAAALGPELSKATEVLIADDGDDGLLETVATIKNESGFASLRVLRGETQEGKGAAIARGVFCAQAPVVGFLDADLSTPAEYIPQALRQLDSGFDIVIGSRRIAGAAVAAEQSLAKRFLSGCLSWFVNQLLFARSRRYLDTQCGFKFFDATVARELYSEITVDDGMTDIEILLRANRSGYRVAELPVIWTDLRPTKRPISRTILRDIKGILKLLYQYNLRSPGANSGVTRENPPARSAVLGAEANVANSSD